MGYTTVTTSPGFNMLGVVFNGLGGQTLPIKEIVSGDFQEGDEIHVRKDGAYHLYYYDPTEGWYDGDTWGAPDTIAVGSSIWLKTRTAGVKLVISGI